MTPVRALLQWTTVLPLGAPADFEAFARRSWLYPGAGYVTGGIAALIAMAVPDTRIAAALALAAVVLISGGNHLDGLLDFGDGMMAHGSRDVRIRALTDRQIGTGGVAAGILMYLVTYAGLSAGPSVPCAILAGEVLSKGALAVLTVTGAPFRDDGIHHFLHARARWYFIPLAVLLCLPLLAAGIPAVRLAAGFAAAAVVTGGMQLFAGRLFGGVNGDVAGATHEAVRAAVILVFAFT